MASAAVEGTRLRAALLAQAQAVLALHTIVGAGLPPVGLQALMRHIVLAKVGGPSPAWWTALWPSHTCGIILKSWCWQQLRLHSQDMITPGT